MPKKPTTKQEARETEFNGHPVIQLYREPDEKFPFTMGIRKCELVLKHLDAIRAFAKKHEEVANA